jgi:hypothetical protein
MVDRLSESCHGKKARELSLSDDEQRRITTLVRLIGNLCFRCRQNQDLMRTTLVPLQESTASVSPERTALHVLLSCTSFAYGCFTLREWVTLALRNVLEGNHVNQNLVEQLEAQQPVQKVELEKLGLSVKVDRGGQVKLVRQEGNATDN